MAIRFGLARLGALLAAVALTGAAQAQLVVTKQHNFLRVDWSSSSYGHGQQTVTDDSLTSYSHYLEHVFHSVAGSAQVQTVIGPARIDVAGETTGRRVSFYNFFVQARGSQSTSIEFHTATSGLYQLAASTFRGTIDFKTDGFVVFHLGAGGNASFRAFQLDAGHTYEADLVEGSDGQYSTYSFSLHQ